MMKRSVIDEVGGLDERFEMYSEDSEWCLRVRRAGMVILFDPRATVIHYGGSFALARWGHLGMLKVKTEAYLLLQRVTLSRLHRVANVITLSAVTIGQLIWQSLRGGRAEEARMRLALYGADLAREFGYQPRR
jgi:GT2 family glycosyltransferase